MKKRLLSIAFALLFCVVLLPAAALAEEEEKTEIPAPPVVKEVEIVRSGAGCCVEVTISTPTTVRNLMRTLSMFNLDGLISRLQISVSVDGGMWQQLDMTFIGNEDEDQWDGRWRSGTVSALKQESELQLRLRYYGVDEENVPIMSQWSDTVFFQSEPFDFNAHDWAKPELTEADGLGLIPVGLRTADLTQPITRSEFAAVSVKVYEALSGLTAEPAAENPFTDTSDPEVLKALHVGITNGLSETEFGPDALLNREQAATMLSRVYKKVAFEGWTLGTDGDFAETFRALFIMPEPFADDADISSWARDSVYFMASNGILKGMDGGTFQPRAVTEEQQAAGYAQATREQAILIAVRLVKNLGA